MTDHTERDLRNIRACKTMGELDGYEAHAKTRGLDPHEVNAIYDQREALRRKGVRT